MSDTVYKYKDKGDDVVRLQNALINLGIGLPKYGVDADLGKETWAGVEEYYDRHDPNGTIWRPLTIEQSIDTRLTNEILHDGIHLSAVDKPPGWVKVDALPGNVHGQRSWGQIDTIVLHQCGIWMTDTPKRFSKLKAHIGILDEHETPIVQVGELTGYMYQANTLNKRSIGIELNGHFPGLEESFHPHKYARPGPTDRQVGNAQSTVRWLIDEVASHGGALRYIVPHRVSSMNRRSDPGERAWKEIGLWAMHSAGLCDFGSGFTQGGLPIPHEWCAKAAYKEHSY